MSTGAAEPVDLYDVCAGDYRPGDQLGKYRVLEVIGRGSNGVTYKVCKQWAYN